MNDINIIMEIISSMTNERAKQIVSSNTNIKKEQLDVIEDTIKVIERSKQLSPSERLFVVEYTVAYMYLNT